MQVKSKLRALRLLLDDILVFFSDGSWHTPEEIVSRFNLDRVTVQEIVRFFVKYGLLRLDEDGRKAVITPLAQRILRAEG
nr:hypothetical protein [Candidatus Njordarchaeum guaymaensis]